jgi:hypothetical protein
MSLDPAQQKIAAFLLLALTSPAISATFMPFVLPE